jgi:hypothetical protein
VYEKIANTFCFLKLANCCLQPDLAATVAVGSVRQAAGWHFRSAVSAPAASTARLMHQSANSLLPVA